MKKLILLLILLPCVAHAQFSMVAAWNQDATFSPANIDSLVAWYVASDLADSLGKSVGDTLHSWPNRAKWTNPYVFDDLYQLTAAQKPLYGDSAWAQHVLFDGVDDGLRAGAIRAFTQPMTYYIVFRGFRPAGADRYFDGQGANQRHLVYNGSGNLEYTAVSGGATGSIGKPISIDSVYIITVVFNGASSFIRANGLQFANTNQATVIMNGLVIGNRQSTTANPLRGAVAEFIAYHSANTAGNITNVESYLLAKYGRTP